MKRALPALPLALAVACTPTTGGGQPYVTYHEDVRPILERSCVDCHSAGNIGPFPLTTYAEVDAVKELVKASVEARTMPPWLAAGDCEEYLFDNRLTDDEIATIAGWVDAGAHEGVEDIEDAEAGAVRQSEALDEFLLDRVDLEVGLREPYAPPAGDTDDYRCFVVDWPETETRFVAGFSVVPGNPEIVHHVIAYLAPPNRAGRVDELDAAEEGPGYTCFGGPGFGGNRWLGAWAPGTPGLRYPEGTGLRVEPGSKVVLQMHYYTRGTGDQADQTEVHVQLENSVEKEAMIFPFTNPLWTDGVGMSIPAGRANVSHAFDIQVRELVDQPVVLHSANLHMHQLGTSAVTWIERSDQSIDCLLDIPRWDFDWQITYPFQEAKIVYPEDKIGIECLWDNSAEHQPVRNGVRAEPRDVAWGEGTGDEMCLGIFYVSML